MADGQHALDADVSRQHDGARQRTDDGAVPPVVELAVVEQVGNLQQQGCPQQRARPVDAQQGQFLHETEVAHAGSQYQQVDQHQGGDEQVHARPVIVVQQPGSHQVGQLHATQDDDVQQGEEDGEVAFGRHPQLYVRHGFESTLNLADAFDKAHRPQQGQKGDVGRHQVAHQCTQRGGREQRLVGEAELHAKQQREVDGHARQIGVKAHHQVLAHQRHTTHHLVERTQIDAARKLEGESHEHINPRLHLARYKLAEHGHRERPVKNRCSHSLINISPHTPD